MLSDYFNFDSMFYDKHAVFVACNASLSLMALEDNQIQEIFVIVLFKLR